MNFFALMIAYYRTYCPLFFILVLAMITPDNVSAANYPPRNSNYIDSVDRHLKNSDRYTRNALNEIQRRRENLSKLSVDEQLEGLAELGSRYEQILADSAMAVYNQAERLAESHNKKRFRHKFRYRRGSVLPMMGLVREGIDTYLAVPSDSVSVEDKFDFYNTGHHIFDAAVDYYSTDSLKEKYRGLSRAYADSALMYVKPGTVDERYFNALPKLHGSESSIGIAELIEVLNQVKVTDPLFAKAAAEIAEASRQKGDLESARYFLAISAIGDLTAGTREATSLHRLGHLLYDEHDYDRAYDYLSYALESAVSSGSRLRSLEISEMMPVVVKSGRELEQRRALTLTVVVISLSVALVVFVAILIYTILTHRRLRRVRAQLAQLNDSKDEYIRKLISLCGVYLAALENFNKMAGRKIKVGQVNELLEMIESGKIMREQLQTFYEVFDDAFLTLYPDFVEKVNALLLPGKRLSQPEDLRLGTELRILAFMRLGMDDSAQIAKFLGLTLNSVYTYRNKIKNRASNRNTFENKVQNIGK